MRAKVWLASLVLATTLLAGCTDPVTLDITAKGTWSRWNGDDIIWTCGTGGLVYDVHIKNHEELLQGLTEDHWRFEWDGGAVTDAVIVEGARALSPDGETEVRVYGCPREDGHEATRLMLFDRDASEEFAHLLGEVAL